MKFQIRSYNTFWDIELLSSDRQTQSDAYEPTVQHAQVGSKSRAINHLFACPWEAYLVESQESVNEKSELLEIIHLIHDNLEEFDKMLLVWWLSLGDQKKL